MTHIQMPGFCRNCFLAVFVFLIICLKPGFSIAQERYFITEGKIAFVSEAPLETIKAESNELRGVIDPVAHTFAFTVETQSFKGFNSPLQREHFNENYMESDHYSECSFSGKIIDEIDFNKPGIYVVRAKGLLLVKGIARERIIRSTVEIKPGEIDVKSDFMVLLVDHSIRIPRIVFQKISPEIQLKMNATLKLKSKT